MQTEELNYPLPPDRIATHPATPRDHSRLMVVRRSSEQVDHRRFYDLPDYLLPTDLLVVNDTRVIPAKLNLRKPTGAQIPGLFLAEKSPGQWHIMLRTRGRAKAGDILIAASYQFRLDARIPGEKGTWLTTVTPPAPAQKILADIGHVPLPPYIEKQRAAAHESQEIQQDRNDYQTIYANEGQSLAAPTAGLHFTPELFAKLESRGIRRATVDLEVGLGTFLPIETPTLEEHPMHTEEYFVPAHTVAAIQHQRRDNHRIVVVGTTAVRTLESIAPTVLAPGFTPADLRSTTSLKISPGYTFQLTDVLLTNFHLPKSTLIALVAALLGLDRLKHLYQLAIDQNYRFYSYGDAMLILP